MSFDTSALTAYVQNNSKQIALQAVASAKTAKLLIDNSAVQFDVKGSTGILKMDNTVILQDGSNCGTRNALGSVILTDKVITVKPLKDNTNICSKALYSTFFAQMVAAGNSPENGFTPEFAKSVMDNRAALFAAQIEQLIWKGDTSIVDGGSNLRFINGIEKQVGAGFAITATGADIIAKLQSVYLAMPVTERTQDDFRIFVGEDEYATYLVALANRNIFKATDDMALYGTLAKIEPVAGLNASGKVYATRISNLHLGLDGHSDEAKLRFSMESENWYCDIYSSVGVAVVRPELVGVATAA